MHLSVMIVTYNQARYIEQAVRSALAQKIGFEYEIVVADDGSTDGTREIVERIAGENPGRVRLVGQDVHVGVQANFINGYNACTGQYLAVLNGDDYWISPYKLQRQVNFLERHAECAICFHNVLTVHEDGTPEALAFPAGRKEFAGVDDLLVDNFIPSSSVVYRGGLIREFLDWPGAALTWNWAVHLQHAQYGRVGYLADTMAVSRHHAAGLWNGAAPKAKAEAAITMLEGLNQHFGRKYDALIRASVARWQSVGTLDQLHTTFKRLEGEWTSRLEQAQLERAVQVAAAQTSLSEAIGERERLAAELERTLQEKDRIAAERELALKQVQELRLQAETQAAVINEVRVSLDADADGETINTEAVRGFAGVHQRLSEIYRWVDVERTRDLVLTVVPPGSRVLVVSRGDAELLRLDGRTGWHFPQTKEGTYAGAHPADSATAIAHLEELRAKGAQYIVFSGASAWWLDHYAEFRCHLEDTYHAVLRRDGMCIIYDVTEPRQSLAGVGAPRGRMGMD